MITEQQARENNLKVIRGGDGVRARQAETLEKLKALLPDAVNADNQLDLPRLREAFGQERVGDGRGLAYELTFAGKDVARKLADTPSTKELQTEPKQSKTANAGKTSENVVIRGDNLDALKLLQKNYFAKVRMIYIDPPYNTNSDNFLYADNFKVNGEELCEQLDYDPEKLNSLLDLYGMQSHSGWLAFMYPRLKLARSLLSNDGVIFISIDDNEQAPLKILCDEIFGGSNVDCFIWRKTGDGRYGKMKNTTTFRKDHEYVVVAFKREQQLNKLWDYPEFKSCGSNPDDDPRGNYITGIIARLERASNPDHKNFFTVKSPNGKVHSRQFEITEEKFNQLEADKRIWWGKNGDAFPYEKIFLNEKRQSTPSSLLEKGTTYDGTKELDQLLPAVGAASIRPKPSSLLFRLIQLATEEDDIVLDFFAGSGTTGEAVMQINAENGGRRKFILVQWDEAIGEDMDAYKFCTDNNLAPVISSITLERLNRAGEAIKEGMQGGGGDSLKVREELDIGYQVFSLKDKIRLNEEGEQVSAFATVNERRCRADALVNLIAESCVPLHFPITEIEKDLLYRVDNYLYVLGACESSLADFADCDIYVDGYADLNLKEFLNLIGTERKNVRVVY